MKRSIVLLLSVVIILMLFSGCSLLNDEIELISPEDGAVINVDSLPKDTFPYDYDTLHYAIACKVSIQWKALESRMSDGGSTYGVELSTVPEWGDDFLLFSTDSCVLAILRGAIEETLCCRFHILVERGHISKDGKLVPDTIISPNQLYYWRVWAYEEPAICSETWSFTVVKD